MKSKSLVQHCVSDVTDCVFESALNLDIPQLDVIVSTTGGGSVQHVALHALIVIPLFRVLCKFIVMSLPLYLLLHHLREFVSISAYQPTQHVCSIHKECAGLTTSINMGNR